MAPKRTLIIGAGKIAGRHAEAWKDLIGEGAICDLEPERAKMLAGKCGLIFEENIQDALANPVYDIIDVCVPTPYHAEYVMAALRLGRDVFVEKPLCFDVGEAQQILALAQASRRRVQVGYLFRYHPIFLKVKFCLDAGLLGHPHLVLVRMGGRGGATEWKHRSSLGGGAVNEMMVHKLDLLFMFFGEVKFNRVLAMDTILPQRDIGGAMVNVDAEDFALVECLAGDTKVILQSDLVSPAYVENIEVHGDNGSLVASVQEAAKSYLFLKEGRGDLNSGYHTIEGSEVNLFKEELSGFLSGLETEPDYLDLRQAVDQVSILAQIRSWC